MYTCDVCTCNDMCMGCMYVIMYVLLTHLLKTNVIPKIENNTEVFLKFFFSY